MTSTYQGRGAWSKVGGTLRLDTTTKKTVPGPYYMRPTKGVPTPGQAASDDLASGQIPDLNEHAVWYGVLAIKKVLTDTLPNLPKPLTYDGRWGSGVHLAVKEYQTLTGVKVDGIVGPQTAKAMFLPYVKAIAEFHTTLRWQVVVGLIQNESAWDPGAVGYSDSDDHGLCQLNAPSQKFTLDESFDPATAIDRLMDIMTRHIAFFGSESDAIAAYNLGRTGAQLWISEGRPQWFIPLSQRSDPNAKPRDVWAYIARIQNAS